MPNINIKLLSEDGIIYFKKHLEEITNRIIENNNNDWIFSTFPSPVFVEKKIQISDFSLIDNKDSNNKEIDIQNSICIYESLSSIPSFILCDERFWLWLYLDKFYNIVKNMMTINGVSTIKDHWMFNGGNRRGIFFGVLSRCYFRVALTIDESYEDKYELSKWIIENPNRFREFTWRTYSSEKHLVRGSIKGERRAINEMTDKNETDLSYPDLAKYISNVGSVRLLDAISEHDIEEMVYNKTKELLNND